MKNFYCIVFIFFVGCFLFNNAFPQTCQECKNRFIIVYDLNVTVPAPQGTDSDLGKKYAEWWNLFYIAGGVRNAVWQDATSNCLVKLCSAFYTQPDSINTSITFGTASPNLPPSGSAGGGADYIIYGTVSGSAGSYNLELKLETAKSRESVKGVNIPFSAGFDPFQVGENAAKYFSPLYDKMMEFEKKKRDEGEPYAIRPKIEAKPEKTVIPKNGTTNVEFTVKDCDDQPLKNRDIQISSENGAFDKETITTDDNGKATAVFTAGPESGIANISSTLVYRMPTDASSLSTSDGGNATIEIEKQKYWKLLARYYWQRTVEGSTDMSVESFSSVSKTNSVEYFEASFTAYLDMASALSGTYYTNALASITAYGGTHSRSTYTRNDESKYSYLHQKDNSNCTGTLDVKSEKVKIWVDFGAREGEILFKIPANVNGDGGGETETWVYPDAPQNEKYAINCDDDEVLGYDFHARYGLDTTYNQVENVEVPSLMTEKTVTSVIKYFKDQDGVYVFGYDEDQVVDTKAQYETNKTSYKTEFFGELITDKATSVEDKNLLVDKFELAQNYPNPFNPATTIVYNLGRQSNVKITVTNLLGESVKVINEGAKSAGVHLVRFDGSNLASGIYFYTIDARPDNGRDAFRAVKKMVLLK